VQASVDPDAASGERADARAQVRALESERRLWEGERAEGLHRLAAGLAHELNNPLGAALANLDFVVDGLARRRAAQPDDFGSEAAEVARAAADARVELRRLAQSLTARLAQAVEARRAAVCSAVESSVHEAVARYVEARPDARPPLVRVAQPLSCGVPMAECARWILRVLLLLHGGASDRRSILLLRTALGPCVRVRARGARAASGGELAALGREIAPAGARLRVSRAEDRLSVELVLPAALGESTTVALSSLGGRR